MSHSSLQQRRQSIARNRSAIPGPTRNPPSTTPSPPPPPHAGTPDGPPTSPHQGRHGVAMLVGILNETGGLLVLRAHT